MVKLNEATLEYIARPTAIKLEDAYEHMRHVIKHKIGYGEFATLTRWNVFGVIDWLTPQEADIFLDEIGTWVIDGHKIVNLNTVVDEDGSVVQLLFNLKEVEA